MHLIVLCSFSYEYRLKTVFGGMPSEWSDIVTIGTLSNILLLVRNNVP